MEILRQLRTEDDEGSEKEKGTMKTVNKGREMKTEITLRNNSVIIYSILSSFIHPNVN